MHFTSVDLPAPLSPTSAVTSPGVTAKSTLCRTSTAPKLLLIPRIWRIGSVATVRFSRGGGVWVSQRGRRDWHDAPSRNQLTPACVQSDAYAPVQTWSFGV